MALSQDPTIAELQALAEKYADEDFTREDSIDAGNCEDGTDEFIEEYLDGQTVFKIRDLAPHIESNYGVRAALTYKFRLLGEEPEPTQASTDTPEDDHPF